MQLISGNISSDLRKNLQCIKHFLMGKCKNAWQFKKAIHQGMCNSQFG